MAEYDLFIEIAKQIDYLRLNSEHFGGWETRSINAFNTDLQVLLHVMLNTLINQSSEIAELKKKLEFLKLLDL